MDGGCVRRGLSSVGYVEFSIRLKTEQQRPHPGSCGCCHRRARTCESRLPGLPLCMDAGRLCRAPCVMCVCGWVVRASVPARMLGLDIVHRIHAQTRDHAVARCSSCLCVPSNHAFVILAMQARRHVSQNHSFSCPVCCTEAHVASDGRMSSCISILTEKPVTSCTRVCASA